MKRLAIISTHPIQYNAPFFKLLAQRTVIQIKVFYTWGTGVLDSKYDPGFGKVVEWDIPLLEGYDFEFAENISTNPGSHHFKGIDTPHLKKAINEWNPDAILVYGWSFKSHLQILRHFKGKKTILFRGDSTLLDEQSGHRLKKFLRKIFLTWVYRHIDQALYVGSANKDYFLEFGLKEKQLLFAPHAIDNERFENRGQLKEDFRQRLNISDEAVVFLFAGKLEDKKDPGLMLEAFCASNSQDSHLIIAGNGILENELIKNYSLKLNIHFLDFQNQSIMPSLYQSADIFVLPSKGPGETWGLAVNEAMAAGNAVIVSDRCGCASDLVKDDINGYVFASEDLNALIDCFKRLGNNKQKIKDMGLQSKRLIKAYDYETFCKTLENSVL